MKNLDTNAQFESLYYADYDDMLKYVFRGDSELFYLDTYLRETFAGE